MTPPQKKIHYGKIEALPLQLIRLGQALSVLNPPSGAKVQVKMELGHEMTARVITADGIAIGEFTCTESGSANVNPLVQQTA